MASRFDDDIRKMGKDTGSAIKIVRENDPAKAFVLQN